MRRGENSAKGLVRCEEISFGPAQGMLRWRHAVTGVQGQTRSDRRISCVAVATTSSIRHRRSDTCASGAGKTPVSTSRRKTLSASTVTFGQIGVDLEETGRHFFVEPQHILGDERLAVAVGARADPDGRGCPRLWVMSSPPSRSGRHSRISGKRRCLPSPTASAMICRAEAAFRPGRLMRPGAGRSSAW